MRRMKFKKLTESILRLLSEDKNIFENINVENEIVKVYGEKTFKKCDIYPPNATLAKFYEELGPENVQIVTLRDDNKDLLGRALLWHNVKDKDGKTYTFLDSQYPVEDEKIMQLFRDWALWNNDQNYLYRYELGAGAFRSTSDGTKTLYFQIPKKLFKSGIIVPAMDTFFYGDKKTGILSNSDDHIAANYIEFNNESGKEFKDQGFKFNFNPFKIL